MMKKKGHPEADSRVLENNGLGKHPDEQIQSSIKEHSMS